MPFAKKECNLCGKKYQPKRAFQKFCTSGCASRHNVMFPNQNREETSTVLAKVKIRDVEWPAHMDFEPDEIS